MDFGWVWDTLASFLPETHHQTEITNGGTICAPHTRALSKRILDLRRVDYENDSIARAQRMILHIYGDYLYMY